MSAPYFRIGSNSVPEGQPKIARRVTGGGSRSSDSFSAGGTTELDTRPSSISRPSGTSVVVLRFPSAERAGLLSIAPPGLGFISRLPPWILRRLDLTNRPKSGNEQRRTYLHEKQLSRQGEPC